ncbi:MAG TPA: helix-turn-helix domain-containing protein, partial [bacterium]|nr:helix-turn-helix domain-containing protein [bacterium]
PAEKMLLGEISALSTKTGWCDASRAHFATWLRCDVTNVTHYITKLEKLGYLEVVRAKGFRSKMRVVTDKFYVNSAEEVVNGIHQGSERDSLVVVNGIHQGSERDSPEIKGNKNKNITLKAIDAETSLQRLDRWISEISTGDEKRILLEAFQMVYKLPAARFDECLAAFRAKASTTAEKYLRRADVVEHFLNFSNSHCKKNPARAASAKYFSAENRAY